VALAADMLERQNPYSARGKIRACQYRKSFEDVLGGDGATRTSGIHKRV